MNCETDPHSKPSSNLNGMNSAPSSSAVHCEALTRLREVLPDSLWPEVRPALSEDVSFGKAELQHGRVLVGLVYREEDQGQEDAEERTLWAHLWKIDCRGSAVLSFYYNTKEELRIGEPQFLNVNFQKWCHMLATDQSPLGCSGGKWEQRLKTVVKIDLLGSGYLNPKDYTFPDLPTIISVISKHKPTHQSRSPSLRNPNGKRPSDRDDLDEFVEQMVEPNSDDDYLDEDNDDELLVIPNSAARATSISRHGIKPFHIQALQEAFPPTVWPRVEACNDNLEEFSPGKVYLGCLPTAGSSSNSSQEVWARVKGKASAKRTGHISYVWNDGRTAKFTYGSLASKMEFAKPFQYLGDPQGREKKNTQDELQKTRNTWRASIAFCVRAALVHAKMIDGIKLPISINPARIVEIIGQNRGRVDNRAARHAALEISDDTNDASGNGFIPTPSSSPIANAKSKKRRLNSDHDTSNEVGDGMPSATTPAPRRFPIATPISPSIQFLRKARETGPGSPSYELAASKQKCVTLEAEVERQKIENETLRTKCEEQNTSLATLRTKSRAAREQIATLMKESAELQAEAMSLRKLKQAHVRHAQPFLLEAMAFDICERDGADSHVAKWGAQSLYVETYGIEVEDEAPDDME